MNNTTDRTTIGNISYPSVAAAVVFGVHLSARAAFRLDPDASGPAIRTCVSLPTLGANEIAIVNKLTI